ncbi:MAG: 50S ribosomal protein L5 [Bacteriovoracaceae bacterium]|jgi:large subunit ribosomal protein L5|nr:50S ribosomal protein L5 [Bacteriovoracaceae bacterium]
MSRLKQIYDKEVRAKLKDELGLKNINQVPKMERIVINCVTRDCVQNGKIAESIMNDLACIAGQKAVVARAKKSIASFKVREGQALGAFVTLRGKVMYEFLDRLVNISLPRVRDFKGVSPKSFDGRGNYSMGMKEQIIFPEINYDKIDKIRGLGISFVTTADSNEHGRALLKALGMPFREK